MARVLQITLALILFCTPGSPAPPAAPAPAGASAPREPKPKPAKLKISGYGILGNRELRRMLVTLELGGKKPEYFGAAFVEDAALILSARIKRDGYLEPKIQIRLNLAGGGEIRTSADELLENPLPHPLRITRLRFQVHKGVLYHFKSLAFTGLTAIPAKQARSYFMETETLFSPNGGRIYTPERLRRGISSLADALDQLGYAEAKIETSSLRLDKRTGAVTATVHVEQGPKIVVRSVRENFFYQKTPRPEAGRTVFPWHVYSRLWLQDFTLSIKTNQFHQGFPDTTVDLKILRRVPAANEEQVDLEANVECGSQVRLGAIQFENARHVRPSVLARRVRIKRGELLDPIQVEAGRVRLARLGIFDSVGLAYQPVNEHERSVIYRVEESKRFNVHLMAGWGSYEMLRGGVEASLNDIWGLAHNADIKAVQSFKASSGELRYTVPELVGRDYDLFVHGSGLRRQEVSFTRLEYGGGIGLHKYFAAQATDFTARYDYRILSTLDFSPFQEVASEGLTNPAVGSILFEIKHDRRDNPLYPRSGYKFFLTVQTATSYLGGEANFERIEVTPSWHHRLGGGRYLSVGVEHGIDVSFGSPANNLPFNSRFFPGGETSIRGYPEGEASPRNEFGQFVGAETYMLGTVQLEQALTAKFSLVFFSDSLGMARRIEHYPFDTGLFSVGAGIWWRTLIGPVRLEYGRNLNPRPGDPSGTLQFSLGFPF